MFKVIRNFMGEEEIEAKYKTREEAQGHIDKAQQQERNMNSGMPIFMVKYSNFRIEETK